MSHFRDMEQHPGLPQTLSVVHERDINAGRPKRQEFTTSPVHATAA